MNSYQILEELYFEKLKKYESFIWKFDSENEKHIKFFLDVKSGEIQKKVEVIDDSKTFIFFTINAKIYSNLGKNNWVVTTALIIDEKIKIYLLILSMKMIFQWNV